MKKTEGKYITYPQWKRVRKAKDERRIQASTQPVLDTKGDLD